MSLRARLALGSAAAVAVAIVASSITVYFLVRSELRSEIDNSLRSQAVQIQQLPGRGLTVRVAPHQYAVYIAADPFSGQFQFVDSSGNSYRPKEFNSLNPLLPGVSEATLVAAGKAGGGFRDARQGGAHLRIFTTQLSPPVSGEAGLALQVAAKLTDVDNELARIRLWLLLVAAIGVGIAAVSGFLVARATLRPLRELSKTAERVAATRDLSERIEVEGTDELATLAHTFNAMLVSLEEAQQRQRQLVQDASHELRTPLTSLRTNVEVLAQSDRLPPGEREHLIRDVVSQLEEMTELIGELTQLARGQEQAEPLEEVRLDLVAEEAIRRTTRNHPDIPIEADLAAWTVVGQPAGIERAIANLLDNAAKWSPAGSPVEVKLEDGELTVRDHGPGIAAEDVPHVFERFYRATSARSMPGSGLGLAIVLQVAEAHHGSVAVEEPPGGGALVRLRLGGRNGDDADGTS